MPTGKRQAYDGAIYHIRQRGNNGQQLFKETQDYSKFISLIKRYKTNTPLRYTNIFLWSTKTNF